ARVLPRTGARSALTEVRRLALGLEATPDRRYLQWLTFDRGWKKELYTDAFAGETRRVESVDLLAAAFARAAAPSSAERTAHADVQLYLPDDLLVKMDVASMAHSLEVRSPFLDHEVMEFAARLPRPLKMRGLVQKYLVRRAMKDVLPDSVLRRKKRGFAVP